VTQSIDILASKLVFNQPGYGTSSRRARKLTTHGRKGAQNQIVTGSSDIQKRSYNVQIQGAMASGRRTSSEERIVRDHPEGFAPASPIALQSMHSGHINVTKIVDVQVYPADE
jgi:hypothetical protein